MTLAFVAKKMLPVALGATLGFAYWYFFGCINGCMITGHWYTSTGYGMLVGAAWLLPARNTKPALAPRPDGSDSPDNKTTL
jgi:hypothetical protein